MNDTIWTAIISGAVIILGAFLTTRATIANYMHGGSQKDLSEAATKYAEAAGKMADLNTRSTELNKRLQEQLELSEEKIANLEDALVSARALCKKLQNEIDESEDRRKGIIMKFQAEINDLRKSLLDATDRIEKQARNIEQLLSKQYQLSENFAGVARESKHKDEQIRVLMDWIEKARNIMVDRGIVPPPLEIL